MGAHQDTWALIQRSGQPREYTVTRAGPQNHDSVGSVERGVREVKEGIAVIRLELVKENCDLQDSLAGWEACARYVVAMRNLQARWRTQARLDARYFATLLRRAAFQLCSAATCSGECTQCGPLCERRLPLPCQEFFFSFCCRRD